MSLSYRDQKEAQYILDKLSEIIDRIDLVTPAIRAEVYDALMIEANVKTRSAARRRQAVIMAAVVRLYDVLEGA